MFRLAVDTSENNWYTKWKFETPPVSLPWPNQSYRVETTSFFKKKASKSDKIQASVRVMQLLFMADKDNLNPPLWWFFFFFFYIETTTTVKLDFLKKVITPIPLQYYTKVTLCLMKRCFEAMLLGCQYNSQKPVVCLAARDLGRLLFLRLLKLEL